jgi:hypothetical protein
VHVDAGEHDFKIITAKILLARKINMIQQTTSPRIGGVGLTSAAASGISHAQAGLAKLRPPLPSTI